VTRYLVAFANHYRRALIALETGDRAGLPRSWRIAFETARAGVGLAGSLDELTSDFSLVVAREGAWETAVALANARTAREREAVRRALDFRAGVVAKLLVAGNLDPVLVRACRQIEAGAPLETWLAPA